MRYLLHYPMIHFSLEFLIEGGKRSVDEKWNEFQSYLQTQPSFDRIYKEGVTKRKNNCQKP